VLLAQGGRRCSRTTGTPGGHSELNVVHRRSSGTRRSANPLLDFNYGVGERIQLKVELPWLVRRDHPGPDASGVGNVLLGFKYRFLDQDQAGVAVSVYPQTEFRTSAHSRRTGLVGEGMSFLLPAQVSWEFGPVAVCVELGYLFVEEAEARGSGVPWVTSSMASDPRGLAGSPAPGSATARWSGTRCADPASAQRSWSRGPASEASRAERTSSDIWGYSSTSEVSREDRAIVLLCRDAGTPVDLVQTIPMAKVQGRIDHLAYNEDRPALRGRLGTTPSR
jgi:hypothetical protein